MSGVLGPQPSGVSGGAPGLSSRLHGRGHHLRYHVIDEAQNIEQRLDASLVPPDRTRADVALRRSVGNWVFFVPAAIAVLWLSTVIVELALVTSVLLSVLVLGVLVPSLAGVLLAIPKLVVRPLTRAGRAGYFWFVATTVIEMLDCGVYGTCLFLLARAGGFAHLLPLQF